MRVQKCLWKALFPCWWDVRFFFVAVAFRAKVGGDCNSDSAEVPWTIQGRHDIHYLFVWWLWFKFDIPSGMTRNILYWECNGNSKTSICPLRIVLKPVSEPHTHIPRTILYTNWKKNVKKSPFLPKRKHLKVGTSRKEKNVKRRKQNLKLAGSSALATWHSKRWLSLSQTTKPITSFHYLSKQCKICTSDGIVYTFLNQKKKQSN